MKRTLTILLSLLATSLLAAESAHFYRLTVNDDGLITGYVTVVSGSPVTLGQYEVDATEELPAGRPEYWRLENGAVRAATTNEVALQLIADADKEYVGRMKAENAFFTLTEGLLTAIGDPRAGQTPPVKLSFADIDALVSALPPEAVMLGVQTSLKLLAVNGALQRYDLLWWDSATYHPELNW